jgi:HD-like signal output (HDOD) protein
MNFPPNITQLVKFLDAQKIDDSLSVLHIITSLSRHLAAQNASYELVAEIVEKSEPLTLEILAAAGRTRGSSPTVLEALLQLGNTRIKKIITLHSFRQIHRTFQSRTPRDIQRNNVWSFSYSHALLAQRCNDVCGTGADVYLAALLERTGVILFDQFFYDAYAALVANKPDNCNRYDWEMMHLGYNSIEVGARYLEHLKIEDIASQVRAQLRPQTESDEVRYFARHLTLSKVPVFFDDAVYDEQVIAKIRARLGPGFEESALVYLKSAFQNSLAA